MLFRDTLYHVPLHMMSGASLVDGGMLDLPAQVPVLRIERARHVLVGNLDNYYHWLIDVTARLDPRMPGTPPRVPHPAEILLLPEQNLPWKRQALALARKLTPAVIHCGPAAVLHVERLEYVPDISGAGFAPHPGLLPIFEDMRRLALGLALGQPLPTPFRRLYISRRDATQRRLVNEDAVIARVRAAGYECITPGHLPVAEQIRIFSEASHIIAPHGAGLANIVFCHASARLCELHMDAYVHWALRALAALKGMRYGCVIGTANEPWQDWAHNNTWTLPMERLDAVLAAFEADNR